MFHVSCFIFHVSFFHISCFRFHFSFFIFHFSFFHFPFHFSFFSSFYSQPPNIFTFPPPIYLRICLTIKSQTFLFQQYLFEPVWVPDTVYAIALQWKEEILTRKPLLLVTFSLCYCCPHHPPPPTLPRKYHPFKRILSLTF